MPPPLDKGTIAAGLLAIGLGCVPLLILAGVIPVKSGPEDPPAAVILSAGLVFVVAGLAAIFQALGRASPTTGDLPPGTPPWRRRLQTAMALIVVVILAAVGSWIAFGPGEREFTGGSPLFGRIAFGAGSVLTWLVAGLLAVRLFRRAPG